MHFQLRIDHGHRIVAHLAGADGVIDRIRARAQDGADVVVGLHVRGEQVLLLQAAQCGRVEQAPGQLEARHHGLDVALVAEEIRVDRGRGQRVGAVEVHAADALGAQEADMTGEAGAPARLAAVVFHHGHAEMQLDVGQLEIGPRLQEAAAFGDVRGHRPAPLPAVLPDALEDAADAGPRQAGEIGRIGSVAEHEIGMVLQVLPDARQMMHAGDAVPGKRGGIADA